jgi:hypothetical protein
MCAGAIGPAMVDKIAGFSLPLEDRVIRRIAEGYEIHGRDVSVTVRHPEGREIYTVFRGGGPVLSGEETKSFDQFLLDAAVARGAEFVHERVERIEKTPAGYRLAFPFGPKRDFDFLVGAFGVNSSLARTLPFDYRPPKTWHTVQAEIPAGNEFIVQRLRNRIHIIPAWGKAIRFLAITPKDDFRNRGAREVRGPRGRAVAEPRAGVPSPPGCEGPLPLPSADPRRGRKAPVCRPDGDHRGCVHLAPPEKRHRVVPRHRGHSGDGDRHGGDFRTGSPAPFLSPLPPAVSV